MLFSRAVFATLAAIVVGAPKLCGAQVAPTAYPQWITSFSREYLTYDSLATSPYPTWVRLLNGDVVVVTDSGGELVLRRHAADGSVIKTHTEWVGQFSDAAVIVKGDPATDSIYVLTGAPQDAGVLMRFDGNLQREWSLPIAYNGIADGSYLGLRVLSDGSVVALRAFALARIGRDGQTRWSIEDVGNGRRFRTSALATASDDTIWVATDSRFTADQGSEVAILRIEPDGTRTLADEVSCASCSGRYTIDVDVLSDGSASVAGGSDGQSSFFARYSATGERLLWVTDPQLDYQHVVHDGHDSIYVQTSGAQIIRVDPGTGTALWTRTATDFVPRDNGVLATYDFNDGTTASLSVSALNDAGQVLWYRQLSGNSNTNVGRGSYSNGNVEMLIQDSTPSPVPCATYPHLIALDAVGVLTSMPPACRARDGYANFYDFDAMQGVGVLVNLMYQLVALSPDGGLLWQASPCEWCTATGTGDTQWGTAMLTADGGAWAIERIRYSSLTPDGETNIRRIDASGNAGVALPLAVQGANPDDVRLLGTAQDVVVLQPLNDGGLTWQHVRDDGTQALIRNYPIPDIFFQVDDARRLDDGGVSLVTKGVIICGVGCNPRYVSVLRLAADGSLRWRYQFPEFDAAVALAADGSATAAVLIDSDHVVLRKIDVNGQVSEVALGIASPRRPSQLAGPINGRWLLRMNASLQSGLGLWLVDAAGNLVASRYTDLDYSPEIHSANSLGYLVDGESVASVDLLDPDSLLTRAHFSFGAVPDLYPSGSRRLLEDGTLYAAMSRLPAPYTLQVSLTRFSLPGTPASDVLFHNSFE